LSQGRTDEGTFVPISAILQKLHDQAPAQRVTLEWLMGNLHHESFGIIILILAIVAATPGIAPLGGLLLLVPALQMVLGCSEPSFPSWIATRELPTRHLSSVVQRTVPILARLETTIHPRYPIPAQLTKRVVGLIILLLTARLLLMPIPMSNILPALLIAFISLAYLERDGLLLIVGLFAGCLLLMIDLGIIWRLAHGAKWVRHLV
jgi:hypothetical protein